MASPPHARALSVATRLSLLVLIMVSIVFFVFAAALYRGMVTSLEREATQRMQVEARGIVSMVRMYSATVQIEAGRFMDVFAADYGSTFAVDATQPIKVGKESTPTLRANGEVLNLNFTLPDRFTERTSGVATIFVKRGADFVRVSTSLKNADGQRAMGTLLAPDSAAYTQLSQGQSFTGPATLFGTFYMTVYGRSRTRRARSWVRCSSAWTSVPRRMPSSAMCKRARLARLDLISSFQARRDRSEGRI